MFAHDLGIDVWEAIDAASTKPFGFMRFTPGPGVGGHCLPIDPRYLSWQVAPPRPDLPLRRAGQRHQRPHARLRRAPPGRGAQPSAGRPVKGQRILLLGLPTSATPATPASPRRRIVAQLLPRLGADVGPPTPTWPSRFPTACAASS